MRNTRQILSSLSWSLLLTAVGASLPAMATVSLPAIISTHMIVQANSNPRIWGWASPSEKIEVKYLGKTLRTTADADGNWEVRLGKIKPGTKFDLDIESSNALSVKDVLAGEVWVCSGQSNMEFPLAKSNNSNAEFESHMWPQIRFFQIKETSSSSRMKDVVGSWKVYSPQTARNWSAVGYYFAKELNRQLQEPVGMIEAARGGTMAHVWMSQEALTGIPLGTLWSSQSLTDIPYMPSCLFNGMIAGITPYTVKGFTWYQGESNAKEPSVYRREFAALIADWRNQWKDANLPFLFVQLPNCGTRTPPNGKSNWAEIREAQSLALKIANTAMAVTIDVGEPKEIHPTNKAPVGYRLALAALATTYNQKLPFRGPVIDSMKTKDGSLVCHFVNTDRGLCTTNGGAVSGFQIAGADNHFVHADATITGSIITVSSPQIKAPVNIRYAWGDDVDANLQNGCKLPAPPFRTDAEPL